MSAAQPATRTREGLTYPDLHMLEVMADAISAAGVAKVSLEEMRDWADQQETRERDAFYRACLANGYVPESPRRPLAAARKLVEFMDWCVTHREDIETLFRAKAYKRGRG